jgi:hypothetical protein
MAPTEALDPHFRSTLLAALSSILWADGVVDLGELEALRAAAEALGLPAAPSDLSATVLGGALGVQAVSRVSLDRRERAVLYASAAWMALADGPAGPREHEVEGCAGATRPIQPELRALDELKDALGLGKRGAERLSRLASRVRAAARSAPSPREFEALVIGTLRLADEAERDDEAAAAAS